MSAFSRLLSSASRSYGPVAVAVTPPVAKPITAGITKELAKGEEARKQQDRIKTEQLERQKNMAIPGSRLNQQIGMSDANSGFGSSFGNFLTEASTNILNPLTNFASGLSNLFGGGSRPENVLRQPALTTITNVGARETQSSGVNEAFIGGIPNIIGQASRFLRTPQGVGSALGTGAGVGLSMLGGGQAPMRITRKMKRLAQQAYQLAGMDLGTATNLFAQLSGVSVDERTFVLILTKRFRNDGAVVTKAALRKTKTTIRRLKNMCDMYDSLRPRTAARRRATPMRRATTTLIKN